MKKQLVFGRLLSPSACFQESAMAVMREWRDAQNSHAHCSIVPSVNSAHICTSTKGTQSLLD